MDTVSNWFVVKDNHGRLVFCGPSWSKARDAYLERPYELGRTIVNNKTLYKFTPLTNSQKKELGICEKKILSAA